MRKDGGMAILETGDTLTDGVIRLRPWQIGDAPTGFEAVCESMDALKPWMSRAHDGYRL
jgi:hypothetical protein